MIKGFTSDNVNYYLVAKRLFYNFYSLYGFCSACGKLRCSPALCICGYRELSSSWTGDNKKLDEFIRKSQMQTESANEAYLEWIPFDCIRTERSSAWTYSGLPTRERVKLVPLEITDETDDTYYYQVRLSR